MPNLYEHLEEFDDWLMCVRIGVGKFRFCVALKTSVVRVKRVLRVSSSVDYAAFLFATIARVHLQHHRLEFLQPFWSTT